MAVVEKERLKCTGVRQVRDCVLDRLARAEVPPGTGTEILHVGMVPSLARSAPYLPPRLQPQPPPTGPLVLLPERGVAPVPEALRPEDCPFEPEVAPPYAVDLRRLCELSGTKVPPEVQAKLGASVPILIYHRMTPFARPGKRPHDIWGMGYTVWPIGLPSATTVDLVPSTKLATFASTQFKVAADVGIGGKMGLLPYVGVGAGGELEPAGDPAAAAGPAVPGWLISDTKLSVSADVRFAFILGLDLDLSSLEVQAGPVKAGGARWNLYRRGKRIDVTQTLVHTITVPGDVTSLKVRVKTWICERGPLGGPATKWDFAKTFTVSLEGLGG